MRAVNIEWDADNETCEECGLPRNIDVPAYVLKNTGYNGHNEAELISAEMEEIGDWLSDTFGFCHAGFELAL